MSLRDVSNMLYLCYKNEVEKRRMTFKPDEATKDRVERVAKWLQSEESKAGLLLYGGCGTGKSTMARAICTLIDYLYESSYDSEKRQVIICSAYNISKYCQDSPKYYDRLKSEELLFIDDMGIEPTQVKLFGNECSPLTELLYARYDYRRWTVISTNLDDVKISERYGDRIGDRINEMFGKLYFNGKSYRSYE